MKSYNTIEKTPEDSSPSSRWNGIGSKDKRSLTKSTSISFHHSTVTVIGPFFKVPPHSCEVLVVRHGIGSLDTNGIGGDDGEAFHFQMIFQYFSW